MSVPSVEQKENIGLRRVKAVYVRKFLSQFITVRLYIYWEILFSCIEAFFLNIFLDVLDILFT